MDHVVDMTYERQRGSYLNLINLVFVLTDAIGPLIGASFAQKVSWRWIFLLNAPFGPVSEYIGIGVDFSHLFILRVPVTIILLLTLRCPPPSVKITTIKQIVTKVDLWGMFTLISMLTLLVVALNLGGQARPWG